MKRTLAEHPAVIRLAAVNIAQATERRPSHVLSAILSLICWVCAAAITLLSIEIAGPMVRGWLL